MKGYPLHKTINEIAPVKRTMRSALLHISAMIALSACATTQNRGSQLIAATTSSGEAFGYRVAISGNTALVGAFREDTAMGEDARAILKEGEDGRFVCADGRKAGILK